jgi:hypothetical protein
LVKGKRTSVVNTLKNVWKIAIPTGFNTELKNEKSIMALRP